jgi:hypothetical protein
VCTSEPQIVASEIFTKTSPGPQAGSGISEISNGRFGSRKMAHRAVFIVCGRNLNVLKFSKSMKMWSFGVVDCGFAD